MTHLIPAHHIITDLRTSTKRLIAGGFARNFTVLRSAFRHRSNVELTPQLRYDCGEDDMRPLTQQSLLQQEAARASSFDSMLLRSF